MRTAASITAVVFICLLAACGNTAPEPTGIAQFLTATPNARPTLPPTWTATFTPTALPPTATPTLTAAPSITPTLSAEAICAQLWLVDNLGAAAFSSRIHFFAWEHVITMLVDTTASDVKLQLRVVHHKTGADKSYDIAGGQSSGVQIHVNQLPHPGQYDWILKVHSAVYGDLCARAGSFIVTGRESTRAEEALVR